MLSPELTPSTEISLQNVEPLQEQLINSPPGGDRDFRRRAVRLVPGFALSIVTLSASAIPIEAHGGNVAAEPGVVASSPVHHNIISTLNDATTGNYAGYMADPLAASQTPLYGSVEMDFTVPTPPSCGPTDYNAVSIWAGLGGYYGGNPVDPLYQTGVLELCDHGTTTIRGFYEAEPSVAGATYYSNVISPGDRILALVTPTGYYSVGTYLYDLGADPAAPSFVWAQNSTIDFSTKLSAKTQECIVEAPTDTDIQAVMPLMDFGTTDFPTSSYSSVSYNKACSVYDSVNSIDHIIASTSPGVKVTRITMKNNELLPKASPSDPSSDGNFNVVWNRAN